MKDDLELTFGQIFQNDPGALLAQLKDIEVHHKADRQASEEWAKRLRFIDISDVPDLASCRDGRAVHYRERKRWSKPGINQPCILPLREKEEDDGRVPYIAVSWRWMQSNELPPWGCDIRESFKYQVQRPGLEAHDIDFPNHYLERVILFAQSNKINKIWIDKESIYQRSEDKDEHPGDRDLGIQIMDVVYGEATCCVGLLTTSLMYQKEIYLLAELLSRDIFVDPDDTIDPHLKEDAKVADVQMLVLRLLNDNRWSRGWIFQEDHLASHRMTLLVPHSRHLRKRGLTYDFGKLPGDLKMSLVAFRKAVTMFCMALDESEERWPLSEMLGKAKQYNVWNKVTLVETGSASENSDSEQSDDSQLSADATERIRPSHFPTTTLSILDDVCNRSLEKKEDRVAIMANAAKFERRIDVSPHSKLTKNDAYSLSTVLLALILLNGEILSHRTWVSGSIMKYTLRSYLRAVENLYDAPVTRYEQSFIDRCRFTTPSFTPHGLEVHGHLFKFLTFHVPSGANSVLPALKFSLADFEDIASLLKDSSSLEPEGGRILCPLVEKCIRIVISKLQRSYATRCWLVGFLQQHINIDRKSRTSRFSRSSERYVLNMMVSLVHALIEGRTLRLARLASKPDTSPPAAIFVEPEAPNVTDPRIKIGTVPSFVFTSSNQGYKQGRHDCFASLNVECKPQTNTSTPILESYGWINGVWNVEAKATETFTYQIPGLTDWRMALTMSRKRKREGRGRGRGK